MPEPGSTTLMGREEFCKRLGLGGTHFTKLIDMGMPCYRVLGNSHEHRADSCADAYIIDLGIALQFLVTRPSFKYGDWPTQPEVVDIPAVVNSQE